MKTEHHSLATLFDEWTDLIKTKPSEDEREQLKRIALYTFADKQYLQRYHDPEYFREWRDQLPAYYQRKADVMMAILTHLQARNPISWIVSEIREDIPQLAYFLFARHLELFVLKDPLRLSKINLTDSKHNKPLWLSNLLQKGVTHEDIASLVQSVAREVMGKVFAVTDGSGTYGDLPENAPRPRIVEAHVEIGETTRYLSAVHEYIEDTVLRSHENE